MLIYLITNSVNGKHYIGKTHHSAETRLQGHIKEAFRRTSGGTYLHRAIRKHGPKAFTVKVLAHAGADAALNSLEIKYIAKYKTFPSSLGKGYNMTIGGEGQTNMPEETRRKISRAQMGKVMSKETRRKMSLGRMGNKNRLGIPHSMAVRKKISAANIGRKMPESFSKHLAERNRFHHPRLGMVTSESRKELNRVALRRYWASLSFEERKARNAFMRKPKSKAIRTKISKALRGRPLPETTRRNMSEAAYRRQAIAGNKNALAHFLPRLIRRMTGRE